MKLTTKAIDALKPPENGKEYLVFDDRGGGDSGWLAVRVRQLSTGLSKQFVFVYPTPTGGRRKMKLGDFGGSRSGGMSLKEARDRFEELARQVRSGVDPQARREARKREAAERAARGSFRQLCEAYVASLRERGAASADEVERNLSIAQETVPGDTPAAEITANEIRDIMRATLQGRPVYRRRGRRVHREKTTRREGVSPPRQTREQANRMRGYLQAAFAFALKHDLRVDAPTTGSFRFQITHNPARDVPKVERRGSTGIRDVELSASEIALLWHTLPVAYELDGTTYRIAPDMQRALKLLLATGGQRVQVVTGARWCEFDFKERLWRVPLERRKARNHRTGPHLLPLNKMAVEILEEQKVALLEAQRVAEVEDPQLPEWVFPATRPGELPHLHHHALYKALGRWLKAAEFPKAFAPRDMRQTFMSRAGELGLSGEIRNRIQDRAPNDVGSRHYDAYDYIPEMRKALEAWSARLVQIIDGADVVPIGRGRGVGE